MTRPMPAPIRLITALFLALAVTFTPALADTPDGRPPVTILVSIDGFRADYLDRGITPNLSKLAAGGVTARMRPSFPSKTFPNHWALVTGDYPDHNGIVGNTMEDPRRPGEVFTMASDDPFWWDEAKPIWVAAEQAGIRTATMFWPGSNVAWGGTRTGRHGAVEGGVRPHDWQQFNQAVSARQRVDAILDWLRRPADDRPAFLTLYFDTVDSAGHRFGPDASGTDAAIADVDRSIGSLVAGLAALHQPANLVIVADHGMAAVSSDRVIALNKIVDPADYRLIVDGPYAAFVPTDGHDAALAKALLAPHDHMTCWRKADIPARLHYGTNPRVPPFLCLADVGWVILQAAPAKPFHAGAHGYDNAAPQMAALFVANGPAFRSGYRLPPFDNVDVAPLLRRLIGLPQDEGIDGSLAPVESALAPR
ncbi:ectonucleotide pyrophosphatase/phosphodiesterase [Novosphingobium sp. ZN18A2]|uniref:alkaline phosphatase family protein n=1 Tax=Novosphingobium sp. ZN18A2 TaxID=3079861 RepID=UPI0030CDC4F0